MRRFSSSAVEASKIKTMPDSHPFRSRALASSSSGLATTLLITYAQWCQSFDHAGGNWRCTRPLVDISKNGSKDPAYVSLNPNGRIPAIIDPAGPDGKPIAVWESGAILLYLADKTGQLVPSAPAKRYETLSWVFFQMSAVGPIFGQLGFFVRLGGKDSEDQRPRKRFTEESKRLWESWTDSWKVATGSLTNIRLRTLLRSGG